MKKVVKFITNIVKSIIDNDFFGMAAEMGFWLVIGIFPFMLFLVSVFGWIGKHYLINPIYGFLSNIMPSDAIHLIQSVVNQVVVFKQGGVMAVVGMCITLALSTNAIAVVLKGLNRAYKLNETRNLIHTRALSLVMVFVDTMFLFLSINLIIFGKVIIKFLVSFANITPIAEILINTLRWPIAFVALCMVAALQYYILPDFKDGGRLRQKSTLPGTLFFCLFWMLGSWGFSVYVNNLHTYNIVYGTIGAFAVLMVWLYYTSILILVGGEINSQYYESLELRENGK